MAIDNEYTPTKVSGDATAGPFSFSFKAFADVDVGVQSINKTTGVITELTLTTQFTVSLSSTADGGTITFTAGNFVAATEWVFIYSKIAYTQTKSFPLGGTLREDNVEAMGDRNLRLIQQLKKLIDKTLRIDISEDNDTAVIPTLVTNRYLFWDGTSFSWAEQTITTTSYNGAFAFGTDAAKPAAPSVGDLYFATDTNTFYRCASANVWSVDSSFTSLTITGETILTEVTETAVAMAASDIDLETGTYFSKTISGATTLTFSNPAAAGKVSSFTLELTNPAANITWPASVVWEGGSAPTLTTTGTDILTFFTRDAGTTWYGSVVGLDFS